MVRHSTDIQQHLQQNAAFSTTAIPNRGQGADCVQEEQNKLVKSFLPPGIPTPEIRRNMSRKADYLKHIKQMSLHGAGVPEQDSFPTKNTKHDLEVTMMRRELRSHQICSPKSSPTTN